MVNPRLRSWILGIVGGTVVVAGCSRQVTSQLDSVPHKAVESAEEEPSFYTVGHYDEARDPALDLADSIKRATAEDKRILLQVGGEWCGWCTLISQYMHSNQVVNELLTKHFLVMKVTYPGEHAESFLKQFPKCDAYPHFFVLEKDGKLLHSQGTGELEEGKGYNESVFAGFLNSWVAR
jgi:thiol:disulfide interchange protein